MKTLFLDSFGKFINTKKKIKNLMVSFKKTKKQQATVSNNDIFVTYVITCLIVIGDFCKRYFRNKLYLSKIV